MLDRHLFASLLKYLTVFPVVVLIGPRKSGKTVLAEHVRDWLGKESRYLDLEFGPEAYNLDNTDTYLSQFPHQCVVIDEFKSRLKIIESISDLVAEGDQAGRFLLITSAVSKSLQEIFRNLYGKVGYLVLYPLDRLETLFDSDFDRHWLRGGYPESYLAKNDRESFHLRDNHIRMLIERDLPQLGMTATPQVIYTFMRMVASNNGRILNASIFARSMGVTSPTIKRYLQFLEEAFLITKLQPYKIRTEKRLVKAPKVYISDSGILHALLQIEGFEELQSHIIVGSSWEGYALAQIQAVVGRKAELYFYKTHQGAQVDLLIVRNRHPMISIEIQSNNDPIISKSFRIATKDLQTESNFILTPSSANYQLTSNIHVISLDDMLIMLRGMLYHNREPGSSGSRNFEAV